MPKMEVFVSVIQEIYFFFQFEKENKHLCTLEIKKHLMKNVLSMVLKIKQLKMVSFASESYSSKIILCSLHEKTIIS